MKLLRTLSSKRKRLVIGLMSGTSADGIDACLAEITGSGLQTSARVLSFVTVLYPKRYKEFLLRNSDPRTARLDQVARLNVLIGQLFSDAAMIVALEGRKRLADVDLIGSHGQTICHLPSREPMFGRSVRATLQIGDPSVIAKLTGVVTVGDFRVADVAVGGTGAPLVPLYDFMMHRSARAGRLLLNIGGIANITLLPKGGGLNDVVAFDTGPGNMVIDALMRKLYRREYDDGGRIASSGNIIPGLLNSMSKHPFLRRPIPKSTGREMFGEEFVKTILAASRGHGNADVITTVTEFTALSVYQSYLRFLRKGAPIDELIVSGGGTSNTYLMSAIARYFDGKKVKTSDEVGILPDAKEALCFAILANETIEGHPGNIPRATGARKSTVLGKICLP